MSVPRVTYSYEKKLWELHCHNKEIKTKIIILIKYNFSFLSKYFESANAPAALCVEHRYMRFSRNDVNIHGFFYSRKKHLFSNESISS